MEGPSGDAFGQSLHARRQAAHLSQEALAELAGLSVRTISDLERGIHAAPRRATLEALANAFERAAESAARIDALARVPRDGPEALPQSLRPQPARGALIGRTSATDAFATACDAIAAGQRRLLLVTGEPGIGKTRVLADFAARAHADGLLVMAGRCGGPAVPYGPIAEAVRPHALAPRGPAEQAAVAAIVPELAPFGALGDRDPADDIPAARARMFSAVEDVIVGVAGGRPVVLLIDDLHEVDPSSLDLLCHLARSTRDDPLLLVATSRDTEPAAHQPLVELTEAFRRHRAADRVELHGLDETGVAAVAAQRLGRPISDPEVVELARRTGGNPLYVEQLLGPVDDGTWRAGGSVPQGVRAVIRDRVEQLAPTARRALEIAAVIGSTFDVATITCVEPSCGVRTIDGAIAAGLVDADGADLAFRHGLVRDVIIDTLDEQALASLHWQVGDALERTHAGGVGAPLIEIARHLERGVAAGDAGRASCALERAGHEQFRVLALEDAITSLSAAVQLCPGGAAHAPRQMQLLELLADIYFWHDDPDAMRTAATEAAEIARRHGTPQDFARTVAVAARWNFAGRPQGEVLAMLDEALDRLPTNDDAQRSTLVAMRAYVLQGMHGDARSRRLAQDAEVMARRSGEADALAHALLVRMYTEAAEPDPVARRRIADELERVSAGVSRADYRAQYLSFAIAVRIEAALAAGDRPSWARSLRVLHEIADERRSRFLRSRLMFFEAAVLLAEGEQQAALQRSADACAQWHDRPDARRVHDIQTAGVLLTRGEHALVGPLMDHIADTTSGSVSYAARAIATACCAAAGDLDEAAQRLAQLGADHFADLGDDALRAPTLRWLGEAIAVTGASHLAADLLEVVRPYRGVILAGPAAVSIECGADRVLGQLHATLGDPEEACDCYKRAAALESACGFAGLESVTREWWARAL
jgi:transcriptional regulator with XRE-family HTH domain/tetratricopeptide (TPR) repeat protein